MPVRLSQPRRRLSFESLEGRALPAGNVTAAVVGGALEIAGDNLGNSIEIRQVDADSFIVAGITTGGPFVYDRTRVNGSTAPQQFNGVTGNIRWEMFAGNDLVTITDLTAPNDLRGRMGIGNDAVILRNVTVTDDLVMVLEGGADRFTMTSTTPTNSNRVRDRFVVSGSSGNDTLQVGYATIDHDLVLNGRSGNDTVTVVNCIIADSILVDTSTENDTVRIQSNIATSVAVTLGDGINSALLAGGIYDSVTVTGGADEDTVTCNSVIVVGDLTIDTADRADFVTLDRCRAERFVVDVGDNQRRVGNEVEVTRSAADWGLFTCTGTRLNSLTISSSTIQAIVESGFQIVNI